MPRKYDAPKWAQELLRAECDRAGVRVPALVWTRSEQRVYNVFRGKVERRQSKHSSGSTNAILGLRIRAGSDRTDARMLVLHEAAHWIVDMGISNPTVGFPSHNHDATFWDKAFELYKRYRLGSYAVKREVTYKVGAIEAAYRAGLLDRWERDGLLEAYRAGTGHLSRYLETLKKAPLRNAR